MHLIVVPFILLLLILTVLVSLGLGVGLFLHWVLPEIDWGVAAFIGIFASGMAIHFFVRLIAIISGAMESEDEAEFGSVRWIEAIGSVRPRKRRSPRQKIKADALPK